MKIVHFLVRPVAAGLVIGGYYLAQPRATSLLLWQPKVPDSTNPAFHADIQEMCQKEVSGRLISTLSAHGWGIVCVCREVSAEHHRQTSSSSQCGPFTCSFWSRVAIPPPLFLPSVSTGFLFSRSGAYHSFLHCCTHTLSSQGMKGYLKEGFFLSSRDHPQDCSYVSNKKRVCATPTLLSLG